MVDARGLDSSPVPASVFPMAPTMAKEHWPQSCSRFIGLFPAVYALNPEAGQSLSELPNIAREVEPLIERYGDDRKDEALKAAKALEGYKAAHPAPASLLEVLRLEHGQGGRLGVSSDTAKERSAIRDDLYELIAQLKHVEDAKGASADEKKQAKALSEQLGEPVEYAPWWCVSSAPSASAWAR